MKLSGLLILVGGLSTLCTCKQSVDSPTPEQPRSLIGKYKVLTLIEEPYTDNAINDLVLFDGTNQDCAIQPATLVFSKSGLLTTSILPACTSSMDWLKSVGLINASHWVVKGATLGVTPKRGLAKAYTVQLTNKQLELRWQGADSSFAGLYGELVTYSLKLKQL